MLCNTPEHMHLMARQRLRPHPIAIVFSTAAMPKHVSGNRFAVSSIVWIHACSHGVTSSAPAGPSLLVDMPNLQWFGPGPG